MDKLAEKLLKEFLLSDEIGDPEWRTTIFEMMEAYHKAKLAEVTDEDIFVVADKKYPCYDEDGDRITDLNEGFIEGAKAMRDGEIVKSNNTKK